jgi:hypothetical protein
MEGLNMGTRYPVGIQAPGSAVTCLFLVPSRFSAGAQPGMSRTEATQFYTAAGFPISNGRPVSRCGKPARPDVKLVDINADRRLRQRMSVEGK